MNDVVFKRRLKQLFAILLVLALIIICWAIYNSRTFHIVSTSPSRNNVATVSPYFKINFNKRLSTKNINISENPQLGSYVINGKTITINIDNVMNQNKTYTITIGYISDTSGQVIKNSTISFTPVYQPPNDLSQSQTNTMLKNQDKAAVNQPPTFDGTDALINNGLTTQQVQLFENTVIGFMKADNISSGGIIINQSSVNPGAISNGIFTLNFNFSIGVTNYSASMKYSSLETAQITIYSSSGTQLYQAGSVSSGSVTSSTTNQ
jgi:hypothetical protein